MFPCFGYDEPRWFYDWEVENEPRTPIMKKIKYPTNTGHVQYWGMIRNRNRPLMVIRSVLRIRNSISPKQIKDPALVKFSKMKKIKPTGHQKLPVLFQFFQKKFETKTWTDGSLILMFFKEKEPEVLLF
jgi:hypothetical protein